MNLHDAGHGIPIIRLVSVQCDLCAEVMTLPQHCVEQGEIVGLLTCSQCIEDELNARANAPRSEVGMVGSGGSR